MLILDDASVILAKPCIMFVNMMCFFFFCGAPIVKGNLEIGVDV